MIKRRQDFGRAFLKVRYTTSRLLKEFLETDLSILNTFTDISEGRFRRGFLENAELTRKRAEDGLKSIRHFVSTTDLLDIELKSSLSRRCDELEIRLAELGICR
jgi:hypothetical protein